MPPKARTATAVTMTAATAAVAASGTAHQPVAAAARATATAAGRHRPTGADGPGVVGAEPFRTGGRSDAHHGHRRAAAQGVGGDEPGERRRRRQRGDGDDAQHDRPAQRGDAVRAVARIVEDLQPALDGPAAGHGIGGVGEAVLVEGAGHQHAEEHGDGGGDGGRHELAEPGGNTAHCRTDEGADHREPDHGRGEVRWLRRPDRDPSQELRRGEQARRRAFSHPRRRPRRRA